MQEDKNKDIDQDIKFEEKDKSEEQDSKEEKESFGEKVEGFFEAAEDFVYGEHHNINEDIPASMMSGNETRKLLKFQTRRNLQRKIFLNKKALKITLIVIGCLVGLSIFTGVISFIGGLFS